MQRGLISTYAHGVIDYVVGIALILAPNIFGFADLGGAAEIVPRIIGLGILGMALMTNFELGVVKLISFKVHKTIDFFVGLYLALSPWLHGFNEAALSTWLPHVVVGVAIILVGLVSQTRPVYRENLHQAYS